MKSWIIILIGLATSWHYMDIAADSQLHSILMPLLFFFFLVVFVIKIALMLGPDGNHGSIGMDIGSDVFGGDSDSGGGDG